MKYEIDAERDGYKVYQYLFLKGYSHVAQKRLRRYIGQLTINGRAVNALARLSLGDVLEVSDDEDVESKVAPIDMPLDVIFEDEYLLAIDKPPALATLPTNGHYNNSLANAVVAYMRQKGADGFVFRAVNRLDADTSGLALIAKKNFVQHALTGKIEKTYFAAVEGTVGCGGEINFGIKDDKTLKMRVADPSGQSALTKYVPARFGKNITGLLARPVTGRTHQLRVHFAAAGFPIVGDSKYGSPSPLIKRQALHSYRMDFIHPVTGKELNLECAVREDIMDLFP
ncbi:MAG: RluA family pseudouridine synthase [Clostridiales bacterium]|jgi:23S rRNA pseudouridine1911/1915/1917 synthase|nr:RluA family pseudouridine synthase [Clostridiales bacterium]